MHKTLSNLKLGQQKNGKLLIVHSQLKTRLWFNPSWQSATIKPHIIHYKILLGKDNLAQQSSNIVSGECT